MQVGLAHVMQSRRAESAPAEVIAKMQAKLPTHTLMDFKSAQANGQRAEKRAAEEKEQTARAEREREKEREAAARRADTARRAAETEAARRVAEAEAAMKAADMAKAAAAGAETKAAVADGAAAASAGRRAGGKRVRVTTTPDGESGEESGGGGGGGGGGRVVEQGGAAHLQSLITRYENMIGQLQSALHAQAAQQAHASAGAPATGLHRVTPPEAPVCPRRDGELQDPSTSERRVGDSIGNEFYPSASGEHLAKRQDEYARREYAVLLASQSEAERARRERMKELQYLHGL